MACGAVEDNPASLGLRFHASATGGVVATFRPAAAQRGWDDRMHGGLVATLLDAAMTNALLARGTAAVTVDLAVRFVAPAPLDRTLEVSAEVVDDRRGVHTVVGRLCDGERLVARSTGKFMAL